LQDKYSEICIYKIALLFVGPTILEFSVRYKYYLIHWRLRLMARVLFSNPSTLIELLREAAVSPEELRRPMSASRLRELTHLLPEYALQAARPSLVFKPKTLDQVYHR
jgi:hypothetical protein